MPSDVSTITPTSARLLVIDDDSAVRKNICSFLQDSGFDVIEAENGTVGVSLYGSEQPDLVLCDLRMPDVDGLDVIRSVSTASSNTPVIVISGMGEIQDVVQALRLGAADYLMKPIKDLEVLEHSIRRSLKQAELIYENEQYSNQLENSNQQLRQSLDLLRVDQQAGRLVQTRLLPRTPYKTKDFICKHKIVPSLYLSGDFVDYWSTEDGKLLFYIADVSGHGASSAFVTVLFTYLAKDIARRQFRKHRQVGAGNVLTRLNQEIFKANLQKHVTAFFGVIDPDSNTLHYSSAGHYPMPIIGNGKEYKYLEARTFPIGVKQDTEYEEITIDLSGNFSISLFSDGVLELIDLPSLEDKDKAICDIVAKNKGNFEGVYEALDLDKVKDAPDDVAFLSIEVLSH
ncbi:MAG: SpoIIE family protein phosphatase [Pseudomonadales bacterium]|nr:SpoIIE family protein phosphatase [Pseudomonadales bacterium]